MTRTTGSEPVLVDMCVLCDRAEAAGRDHDACWGDPMMGGESDDRRRVCLCCREYHRSGAVVPLHRRLSAVS